MVHRVLPVLVALMPVIAACGGTSDTEPTDDTVQAEIPTDLALVAQFTCNQLRGVAAGGAAPVITKELTRVASLGYTGSEFRDAIRVPGHHRAAGERCRRQQPIRRLAPRGSASNAAMASRAWPSQ
jgi:hypothetical protein